MTRTRTRLAGIDEEGFTLVELMIAMIIIGIGILPIAAVQTVSTRAVVATGQDTRALSIAQGQMEAVVGAGYTAAVTDSGVVSGLNWKTIVTTVAPGLRQVDVTVTWTEKGASRTLLLRNLISMR